MNFLEDSRICFCAHFKIKDFENFNRSLIKLIKKKQPDFKELEETVKLGFDIEHKTSHESIGISFKMYSRSLEKLIKKKDKSKERLLKKFQEKTIEAEKYKESLDFIDTAHEKIQSRYKIPRGSIIIRLDPINVVNEDDFKRAIENFYDRDLVNLINDLIPGEFKVKTCGFLYLDKEEISFIEGFELRKKLEFQKEVREKIGTAYVRKMTLDIEDSPIGIENLAFGEDKRNYNIDLKLDFKTNNISDLSEKYNSLIDFIKYFIDEV